MKIIKRDGIILTSLFSFLVSRVLVSSAWGRQAAALPVHSQIKFEGSPHCLPLNNLGDATKLRICFKNSKAIWILSQAGSKRWPQKKKTSTSRWPVVDALLCAERRASFIHALTDQLILTLGLWTGVREVQLGGRGSDWGRWWECSDACSSSIQWPVTPNY